MTRNAQTKAVVSTTLNTPRKSNNNDATAHAARLSLRLQRSLDAPAGSCGPGFQNVRRNVGHAAAVFDLCENKGPSVAHAQRVTLHHAQVSAHRGREVGFVDHLARI